MKKAFIISGKIPKDNVLKQKRKRRKQLATVFRANNLSPSPGRSGSTGEEDGRGGDDDTRSSNSSS